MGAPKTTPAEIVEKLNLGINARLANQQEASQLRSYALARYNSADIDDGRGRHGPSPSRRIRSFARMYLNAASPRINERWCRRVMCFSMFR